MAIIQCIVCSKKVSSKAETCNYCGAKLKGTTEEQLERATHIQKIKKSRRIQALSFLAIIVFVGGVLLKYLQPSGEGAVWDTVAVYLISAGFLGYIVLRLWAMFTKRK